jgi:hypothetical protein
VSSTGNVFSRSQPSPWKLATVYWKENRAVILIRLGMALLVGTTLCRAFGIHLLR